MSQITEKQFLDYLEENREKVLNYFTRAELQEHLDKYN